MIYTSNFPVTTAKRLKTIEVKANGNLIRAYKFGYTISGDTARSLLMSVQQIGKDATIDASGTVTGGTTLPSSTLRYIPDSVNFNSPSQWADLNGGFNPGAVQYADLNGDGKADLVLQELYLTRGLPRFYGHLT